MRACVCTRARVYVCVCVAYHDAVRITMMIKRICTARIIIIIIIIVVIIIKDYLFPNHFSRR